MALRSWGQLPAAPALEERWWSDRSARLPSVERSMLAYGNGRSYGDVGLNSGETLLHTRGLDRFIEFDEATGRLIVVAVLAGFAVLGAILLLVTSGGPMLDRFRVYDILGYLLGFAGLVLAVRSVAMVFGRRT